MWETKGKGLFSIIRHKKKKKYSHKQWLEQAYNTNTQALVWCPAKKQMQPRLVSMPLEPAAPLLAREMEAKLVSV